MNFENTKRPVTDDRPIDALLAGYAARTLDPPLDALVASHLALSPENRAYVAALESAHGIFLAELDPVPLTGRDRRLVNIFATRDGSESCAPANDSGDGRADAPLLPPALRRYVGCDLSQLTWRLITAGIEQAVIAEGAFGEASFLRCRSGRRFRVHGHTGIEAILVLQGGFSDEHGRYGRGDVVVCDEACIHQPIIDNNDDGLICFRVSGDRMKVHGPITRLIEQVFGR